MTKRTKMWKDLSDIVNLINTASKTKEGKRPEVKTLLLKLRKEAIALILRIDKGEVINPVEIGNIMRKFEKNVLAASSTKLKLDILESSTTSESLKEEVRKSLLKNHSTPVRNSKKEIFRELANNFLEKLEDEGALAVKGEITNFLRGEIKKLVHTENDLEKFKNSVLKTMEKLGGDLNTEDIGDAHEEAREETLNSLRLAKSNIDTLINRFKKGDADFVAVTSEQTENGGLVLIVQELKGEDGKSLVNESDIITLSEAYKSGEFNEYVY